MSKRVLSLLSLVLIVSMVATACGGTTAPTAPAATEVPATTVPATAVPATAVPATAAPPAGGGPTARLKIIFVQHALCAWDSFWCTVENGIKTAATDMNIDATILGPDKFDLEKTAQLIDQAVSAKPDAIALTVTDADLFRAPIQRALDAGIPVVAYNAGKGPVLDNIPYLTYLGQDEYQGGYQGG